MSSSEPSPAVEVKLVVATVVTLLAGIAYAVVDAVQSSPAVLDGLPEWLRFLLIAALPPLLAFLAGYRVPSNRA